MSEPWNLKQRVDPESFDKFPHKGLDIYIEKSLLSEGEIDFSIPGEGEFAISVMRADSG
jgi:hypothetical protein